MDALRSTTASRLWWWLAWVLLAPTNQARTSPWYQPARPTALQSVVDDAVQAVLVHFAPQNLGTNQLAVTLVDLRDPTHPAHAARWVQQCNGRHRCAAPGTG